MAALENLVDAVSRLRPTAVLLLDTNTIMDAPLLESYHIALPGSFLLVVPIVTHNELMSLSRRHKDQRGRQKASRALSVIDDLYARGDPTQGIALGSDRWLISMRSPKRDESVEDEQVRGNLGPADAALLRLSIACAQDCPDTPTLLITRDRKLTASARAQGRPVCRLPDLRSCEGLGKKLGDAGFVAPRKIDIPSHLDPDEERTVQIRLTLEEIRSEGDYLIARGSGRIVDDQERFPFRWKFPYRDLSRYDDLWNTNIHELDEDVVMPPENLDFMGADEQVEKPVEDFVCRILEYSGGWTGGEWSLQAPLTLIRFNLAFEIAMDARLGGFYRPGHIIHKKGKSPEEAERYDRLSKEHDRLMQSLIDGKAEDVGRAYRSAFELREELNELLGWDEEYDNDMIGPGPFDLDTSLIVLLSDALSSWSVGETREEEFMYRPLALPEEEHEPAVVDEEDESDDTESC